MSRYGAHAGVRELVQDWTIATPNPAFWLPNFPNFELQYRLYWEASHLMMEWFGLVQELVGTDITGPLVVLDATPIPWGPALDGALLSAPNANVRVAVPSFQTFTSEWVMSTVTFSPSTNTISMFWQCNEPPAGAQNFLLTGVRFEVNVAGS